jgi:hypothetical protein
VLAGVVPQMPHHKIIRLSPHAPHAPHVRTATGEFLMKDIAPLGLAMWLASRRDRRNSQAAIGLVAQPNRPRPQSAFQFTALQ